MFRWLYSLFCSSVSSCYVFRGFSFTCFLFSGRVSIALKCRNVVRRFKIYVFVLFGCVVYYFASFLSFIRDGPCCLPLWSIFLPAQNVVTCSNHCAMLFARNFYHHCPILDYFPVVCVSDSIESVSSDLWEKSSWFFHSTHLATSPCINMTSNCTFPKGNALFAASCLIFAAAAERYSLYVSFNSLVQNSNSIEATPCEFSNCSKSVTTSYCEPFVFFLLFLLVCHFAFNGPLRPALVCFPPQPVLKRSVLAAYLASPCLRPPDFKSGGTENAVLLPRRQKCRGRGSQTRSIDFFITVYHIPFVSIGTS